MVIYGEQKNGKKTSFVSYEVTAFGEVLSSKVVTCPLYHLVIEGFTYFILYDDNMVPIHEAYDYLNNGLKTKPINTRHMVANALRLLYCFLLLHGKTIDAIDNKTLCELVLFIKGKSGNHLPDTELTERKNNTVNGYLSFYRNYFKYLEIKCDPLFNSHTVRVFSEYETNVVASVADKYDANLKDNSNKKREVPAYISPKKFCDLLSKTRLKNDKQTEILITLMYWHGLRLGEALGLTIEDVEEVEDEEGNLVPVLWIRNRFSDKDFQFAKGLPPVISRKEYKTPSYRSAKQKIVISYDLYEVLIDFINEVREEIETKNPIKTDRAIADKVNSKSLIVDNYYVFVNKHGRVLSDQVWNDRLRKYFEECNIPVDTGSREHNLSHRFRHGFAMLHARYRKTPLNALALQRLMRHKSPKSTEIYYKPTTSDERKDIEEYQNELYDILESAKEGEAFD